MIFGLGGAVTAAEAADWVFCFELFKPSFF